MTSLPDEPLPPGFRWPDGVRAAAMFTFDIDAEAVMLIDHPETADYLDVMAHQRYGPQVAVPRLLRMLDRVDLRTTFFVPGWVADRYPHLADVELTNYKVRILDEAHGTGAVTRVLLDSADGEREWGTTGVSENIIEASWEALVDSLEYAFQ